MQKSRLALSVHCPSSVQPPTTRVLGQNPTPKARSAIENRVLPPALSTNERENPLRETPKNKEITAEAFSRQ
uniref:Uncharacterized protein n=1 Tax=Globodera rostochiensis TaxID=31243 RepID=A0A914I4A2_GLORO